MLSPLPKELVTFAKFVLNRFFALAARNDKAYVELLFWKNVGAVRDMTEGYSKDRYVYILISVWLWFYFFGQLFCIFKNKTIQYVFFMLCCCPVCLSEMSHMTKLHGLRRRRRSCGVYTRLIGTLEVTQHFWTFYSSWFDFSGLFTCGCGQLHIRVLTNAVSDLLTCLSSVPDVVETLLPLLSNSNRTRRQVVVQMVQMGLVDSAKDLKKQKLVS